MTELMGRMGHGTERAALIYQHEAPGAAKTITEVLNSQQPTGGASRVCPAGTQSARPEPSRSWAVRRESRTHLGPFASPAGDIRPCPASAPAASL